MDPIIARLERLERDYRRSRLWNRLALLALLVAVCAGFAQQQDPKLPDVIKCKRIESEFLQVARVHLSDALEGGPRSDAEPGGRLSLRIQQNGAVLELESADGRSRFLAVAGSRIAWFEASEYSEPLDKVRAAGAGARGKLRVRSVSGGVDTELGGRFAVEREGQTRAILGTMHGTDKLGRDTHYPESTLTLLDKDGKFLEQLPR